jgi:hypothetical protein
MGRLIDADKCPCILCKDTRNAHCTYEHRSCEKFCNWLNNTAYDIEKVVAELKEKKDEASIEAGKRSVRIGEDEYEDDPYYEGKKHAYVKAIEIVKAGAT